MGNTKQHIDNVVESVSQALLDHPDLNEYVHEYAMRQLLLWQKSIRVSMEDLINEDHPDFNEDILALYYTYLTEAVLTICARAVADLGPRIERRT